MTRTRIIVIGLGGIGSFLAGHLHRLVLNNQIDPEKTAVTLCDDDQVEIKNLLYQAFEKKDALKPKAEVLGKRYSFSALTRRIEKEEQLEPYNLIICCVDSSSTRELVFRHCARTGKHFIDLRSEGRAACFFTTHPNNTVEYLLDTIAEQKENGSCQNEWELREGIVQQGNVIIAAIGAQLLLNYLRGEPNPPEFRHIF